MIYKNTWTLHVYTVYSVYTVLAKLSYINQFTYVIIVVEVK